MACRLVGAKPLSEPMMEYWTLRNKLQWNLKQNSHIFSQENAFENIVCKMAAILSRPQCDNSHRSSSTSSKWHHSNHLRSLNSNFSPLTTARATRNSTVSLNILADVGDFLGGTGCLEDTDSVRYGVVLYGVRPIAPTMWNVSAWQ